MQSAGFRPALPRAVVRLTAAALVAACTSSGCISRKVSGQDPTTESSFTKTVQTSAVDKVDLLFMIDNSSSMGDKQAYLSKAIPDLLGRLVTPNCVDDGDETKVTAVSPQDGKCPDHSRLEFPAVHDMHIAIVTSSLGARGGSRCLPDATDSQHMDDQGHLINRKTDSPDPITEMKPSNLLDWYPGKDPPATGLVAVADVSLLEHDFENVVTGAGQLGCGIESQLESWYRFLVQPDPYDHIEVDGSGARANWVGIDGTILQQRRAFLRPDSLVAIITLSDENDSEIDVRALGGQAVQFLRQDLSSNGALLDPLARGTAACTTDPSDPQCKSCTTLNDQASDPNCAKGPYTAANDWGNDLNLRHVHMKAKYGVDPQFPISRYVTGLSLPRVPNRSMEYPPGASNYVGQPNCQNPLFAASLPDGSKLDPDGLCNLTPGPRNKNLIFFAHIGGVPNALLHFKANDAAASRLTDDDWTRILGKNPLKYDQTGIDPHMIESTQPRQALVDQGHGPDEAGNGTDSAHGREWISDDLVNSTGNTANRYVAVDLQYACTFDRVNDDGTPNPLDCTTALGQQICDCPYNAGTPARASIPLREIPPVCDLKDPTKQIKAKAYPTTRELLVARLLGEQGVVSSICPVHVSEQGQGDPYFGYRPAVASIVDRLKDALTGSCVPRKLAIRDGQVACLVLETLPDAGDESACSSPDRPGLKVPAPDVLARFVQQQVDQWDKAGGASSGLPDPRTLPVCEAVQLQAGVDCTQSDAPGWCYVEGGRCPQQLLFSKGGNPKPNTVVSLQCIDTPQ